MLLEFVFENYRSFRDENVLSLEAEGLSTHRNILIEENGKKMLPAVAIYGKNGGGKSNVIRALWLSAQFIKNAQRTQSIRAEIPVRPFLLNDYSANAPTRFEYTFFYEGVKYVYGFSATTTEVIEEHLYYHPKKQKAVVFERSKQDYYFPQNTARKKKTAISELVPENQLFLAIASAMNEPTCVAVMTWFRDYLLFSKDFSDIPTQIIDNYDDKTLLSAIVSYAKAADLGIEDMVFDVKNQEIDLENLSGQVPDDLLLALSNFMDTLRKGDSNSEAKLRFGEMQAMSYHKGTNRHGESERYQLDLSDESDGTRKLMALAPAVEKALASGGIFVVDELEKELHPQLAKYIVSKFQSPYSNKKGAQLIFTTHSTEFLSKNFLRRDQLYFADKDNETGVSELYDVNIGTDDNVRKSYLLGKYGAIPNIVLEEF